MRRLKVGTKLLAAMGALLIITGLVAAMGIQLAGSTNDQATTMFTDELTPLAELPVLVANANEGRRLAIVHSLTTNPRNKAVIARQLRAPMRAVDEELARLARVWVGAPTKLSALGEVEDAWEAYKSDQETLVLDPSARGRNRQAQLAAIGPVRQRFVAVDEALGDLAALTKTASNDRLAQIRDDFASGRARSIALTVAAVLLGVTVAVVLSRTIAQNIGEVADASLALARGQLDARARVASDDEIGQTASAFNAMAEKLQEMVEAERRASEELEAAVGNYSTFARQVASGDLTARVSLNGGREELSLLAENLNGMALGLGSLSGRVTSGAHGIATACAQILAAVSQHTASASQQSAAINEISTTVDEVRAAAEQTAAKAQGWAGQAEKSVQVSEEGIRGVEDIVAGMNEIKDKVGAIAREILDLSEQTQQIGDITTTVSDLADQSNLLALNASIEAAKAGEHGKGFAVVAEEVRNLAEQSKQATMEVRAVLGDIQKATNSAVLTTEQGTGVVKTGVELARRAGEVIQELAATIDAAARAAQQIAASAQQQSVGMDQIALAIKEVRETTQQFVAGARQSQDAAESLNQLAHDLKESTDRYRVA